MARNLTYYIDPSANVGDSLSIINTNLVNLDLALNNIHTTLTMVGGMNTYFNDLSSKVSSFNNWVNGFSAAQIVYSQIYATVSILSAYWQNINVPLEFSVNYPVDISIPVDGNNVPTGSSKGNGVGIDILNNLSTSTALCLSHLNDKYPATNYHANTIVTVVLPIYNTLAGLLGPSIVNVSQIKSFSTANTTQNPIYYKPGTFLVGTIKEKFQNQNSQWTSLSRQVSTLNI